MSNPQYQHQHRIINSLKNALSQHRPNQKQPPPLSTTSKSTSNPKQKPFKSHSSLQTTRIIFININKHNSTPKQQIINNINTLIESKPSHLVAIFKDYMIADFIDEFLRREYHIKECFERLPKFANYYKNYLTFFCKPTFSNFYCNHIVQSFGEAKAEIYYNNNYGKNSKPKKKVTMIGDGLKPLFSSTVKEEIENNNSFVTANNDVCDDTEVNNANNNMHNNNNNNKCNDNTISLTMDNSNSRMFIKATNSKNNKKQKLNINTNTNIHFCYPECLTFNSNIIGKRASTESSLASILDMFTQFPTSHNNNMNNNMNSNNAINNKNQQQQQNQTSSLKPKSKPKPTIDMSNIGGNHKHRSRNPPITDRLQISKTQTIPSNTNTDLNNPSNTNTKQQITNPSTNNTRFTSDKQHHTVYSNNSSKRAKYSHKISTLKQTNQLTIQTSTNANINSLCKKSIPYTTRNKSNEYNTNTHNHNNNINNNNNNNKTSNKKTQNTNMNLKNKFKLSTNPPLHLKTMSSNFQSSINTYNKIIKQTTTSNNNNNNNNNNTLSSPKMKKSLNKVSFNSNKHIPTSPGSNARTNTHNNNNKELFSPSNMNLDSIMKLTLKLYHSKDNNAPVSKIHHARCNSSTNNRDTISTPTINNFNININNHICFNNNHSNNSNNDTTGMKPTKANNGKVNIQNLLDINKNNNILSRNNVESVKKDTVLARTNTENNGNKKGYVITMNSPTNGQGVIIRSHNRRLSNGLVYEKKKTSRFLTQRGGSNGGGSSNSNNNNNNGNKLVFGYGKSDFGFLKK